MPKLSFAREHVLAFFSQNVGDFAFLLRIESVGETNVELTTFVVAGGDVFFRRDRVRSVAFASFMIELIIRKLKMFLPLNKEAKARAGVFRVPSFPPPRAVSGSSRSTTCSGKRLTTLIALPSDACARFSSLRREVEFFFWDRV